MNGRRMDLSATQVIASMLAAVTGAVAASYLGVAGTVIGAAVMSVASTAIAAIYKHYLGRSRERLRAAADAGRIAPLAGGRLLSRRATEPGPDLSGAATPADLSGAATRTDLSSAATRADLSSATRADLSRALTDADLSRAPSREELFRAGNGQDRAAGPDDETQILPAVAIRPHHWDDTDRANGLAGPAVEGGEVGGATQIVRRPDHDGPADGPGHQPPDEPAADARGDGGAGRHDDGGPDDARWRRPRPLVLAGIALGIFLLAMAGITAFEAVAGKPLNTLVGDGHGSGTTIGSIVGGSGSQTAPGRTGHARPAQSPSPTPTAPAPTPTPSQAAMPTPTPAPSSTPTTSSGQSPAASPAAPASPAASPAAPASPARAPATPASSPGP
jgi:hypothetical protein